MMRTTIASHRGGAMEWPQNSPSAFRETARLAVEYVEFDVHPSADGVLVVHHDATLERTTSGAGAVREKTWAELQRLTLKGTETLPGGPERMLRLEEVIEIFRPTALHLRVEIKPDRDLNLYPGMEARVARALGEADMLERTMVTSFLLEALSSFRAAATPAEMVWLVAPLVLRSIGGIGPVLELARGRSLREIAPHQADVDRAALAAAAQAGLRLGAFATHEDAAIRRMLDLGVSTFTTDRPTAALTLRAGLNAPADRSSAGR